MATQFRLPLPETTNRIRHRDVMKACRKGHPFSEENTYIRRDRPTPMRVCRACKLIAENARYRRKTHG
jgi:hypothetical protein